MNIYFCLVFLLFFKKNPQKVLDTHNSKLWRRVLAQQSLHSQYDNHTFQPSGKNLPKVSKITLTVRCSNVILLTLNRFDSILASFFIVPVNSW